jgi:carbamoylphosphate synthase large subunit
MATHKVSIETSVIGHDLAEIKAAFFSESNNVGYLTMSNHLEDDIHFGEALILKASSEMTFVDTTLTLNIVYRIIKL